MIRFKNGQFIDNCWTFVRFDEHENPIIIYGNVTYMSKRVKIIRGMFCGTAIIPKDYLGSYLSLLQPFEYMHFPYEEYIP